MKTPHQPGRFRVGPWILLARLATTAAGEVALPDSGSEAVNAAASVEAAPIPLLRFGEEWAYHVGDGEPGADWTSRSFDDGAWLRARAAFHAGTVSTPATTHTSLALTNQAGQPIVTFRFRVRFVPTGPAEGRWLVCSNVLDDGAIFHLNGREVAKLRVPAGPVTSATFGLPGPRGGTSTLVFEANAMVEGTNVLAVEVHQSRPPNRDFLFDASLWLVDRPPPMPDLILAPPLKPHWVRRRFAGSDCETLEGCVKVGERRLLKYEARTINVGDADLVLGVPRGNPLFEFASCHGHYHFGSYLAARLIAADGTVVSQGTKVGFALVDGVRWDPVHGPPTPRFTDDFQGIQRGWSDSYAYFLPCQHVDVTDVPPGRYDLELEIDPDRKLPESNEANNVTRIPVEIPDDWRGCTGPPPHDAFANARVLPWTTASVIATNACATRESGEPTLTNEFGSTGTSSIWFRWTAPFDGPAVVDTEGSNFPCMLGVYSGGGLRDLRRVGSDTRFDGLPKRVAWTAVAGTTYSIAVSGLITTHPTFGTHGLDGEVVLNLNPNRNDSINSAQTLDGPAGSILASTLRATRGAEEPSLGEGTAGRTIWFRWTAGSAGAVLWNAGMSRFPAVVRVFAGAADSLVPAEELARQGSAAVVVRVEAGATYHLGLDSWSEAAGLAHLAWEPALQLHSAMAANQVVLTVANPAGLSVRIESSPDLRRWDLRERTTEPSFVKAIPLASQSGSGFFRARFE